MSLSRGLGRPGRSLPTVLRHLDDDLGRVLYAPDGDATREARRQGGVQVMLSMPDRDRWRQVSRIQAAVRLARYVRRQRGRILAVHANGQSD